MDNSPFQGLFRPADMFSIKQHSFAGACMLICFTFLTAVSHQPWSHGAGLEQPKKRGPILW